MNDIRFIFTALVLVFLPVVSYAADSYDHKQCMEVALHVQGGMESGEYKGQCKDYEAMRVAGTLPENVRIWSPTECDAAVEAMKTGRKNDNVPKRCPAEFVKRYSAAMSEFKRTHTNAEIAAMINGTYGQAGGMTAEQCEFSLGKAKEAATAARSACENYLAKTNIGWVEKENNYGDYCKAPNFKQYFAGQYTNWEKDCLIQYPPSEASKGANKKSYTQFIQDVWNNYADEGETRATDVQSKAMAERKDKPDVAAAADAENQRKNADLGKRMEEGLIQSGNSGSTSDQTAKVVAAFTQRIESAGMIRGKDFDFALCEYSNRGWVCRALKNNGIVAVMCEAKASDPGQNTDWSSCEVRSDKSSASDSESAKIEAEVRKAFDEITARFKAKIHELGGK